MILTTARVNEIITTSHQVTSRVEVWSKGRRIERDAPHSGGTESDEWTSGVRHTLNLIVPRTDWARWFTLPKLEVRVYRGLIAGESDFETLRGTFVVDPPPISRAPNVTIQAKDRWVLVEDDDFPGPVPAYRGRILDVVARLIRESAGLPVTPLQPPQDLIQDVSQAPAQKPAQDMWTKSRAETIRDMLDSIGAEAYFDETGAPVVRDRAAVPSAVVLRDGDGGTIVNVTKTADWTKAYNTWAVSSSNPDVTFPVVIRTLPASHPASTANRRKRLRRYASPLFANRAQAIKASTTLMAKESMPTQSFAISCSPNPTLRAGMRIKVITEQFGTSTCVVTKVDTPIGRGAQSVTAAVE